MDDPKKICILIAASQPSIRSGLRVFLNEQSDLYVITEAQDSHELLKKVEATSPDVILLEWGLLDRSTPILIKTICALDRKPAVIVMSPDSDHQQTAIGSGADAFVKIGGPPRELLAVINQLIDLKV